MQKASLFCFVHVTTTQCAYMICLREYHTPFYLFSLIGFISPPFLKVNYILIYLVISRFTERGRLFAKREVRALQIGTGGLFFTGDATGQLSVWKLNGQQMQ